MCSFNRLIKCLLVLPIYSPCFISLLISLLQVFKQILHCTCVVIAKAAIRPYLYYFLMLVD